MASPAFRWGRRVVLVCGALLSASVCNYWLAQRVLRVNYPADPFAEISHHLPAVREPLVWRADWSNTDRLQVERFARAVGLPSAAEDDLPSTHELLIPFSQVARANPYPPLLSTVAEWDPEFLTFGYLGEDARYHQVTYFAGEADTTPSPFVPKVRGSRTGWGDYFVRYTICLSRDVQRSSLLTTGESAKAGGSAFQSGAPIIDRIDWSTYVGGSSDGFEELTLASGGLTLEIACLWGVWRLRRRRRQRGWVPLTECEKDSR